MSEIALPSILTHPTDATTWQPADWAAARERSRRWGERNKGKREWDREAYPWRERPGETLERWDKEEQGDET